MILSKKQVKTLEWHLEKYYDLKAYVDNVRDDIISSSSSSYGEGGGKSSLPSDTTAMKALKLLNITEEEKWVNTIEKTRAKLALVNKELDSFLVKRYFERKNMIKIMMELNIERTTAYRWREEIILSFAIIAAQEGLIKI